LEQQLSLESSQTALSLNLQVDASQQELSLQPSSPPQSQSSPDSTIPLPHWLPLMVTTPLLSDRQEDLMLFLPMAEQMFPMVQSENLVMLFIAYGFMMYFASASQVDEESGQHWDESCSFSEHVWESQSCTAPKVWPVSWAKTCQEEPELRTTTLAPVTELSPAVVKSDVHNRPIHDTPTSLSVGQLVIRVQ
jgi:hypothetical protein